MTQLIKMSNGRPLIQSECIESNSSIGHKWCCSNTIQSRWKYLFQSRNAWPELRDGEEEHEDVNENVNNIARS